MNVYHRLGRKTANYFQILERQSCSRRQQRRPSTSREKTVHSEVQFTGNNRLQIRRQRRILELFSGESQPNRNITCIRNTAQIVGQRHRMYRQRKVGNSLQRPGKWRKHWLRRNRQRSNSLQQRPQCIRLRGRSHGRSRRMGPAGHRRWPIRPERQTKRR